MEIHTFQIPEHITSIKVTIFVHKKPDCPFICSTIHSYYSLYVDNARHAIPKLIDLHFTFT